VFGVLVLVTAPLPLAIEQRHAIPPMWLCRVICGLGYVVEGRENLPSRPFVSLWKHSSTWDTLAQRVVVPPASWFLEREAGHSAVNQVVAQGRERPADRRTRTTSRAIRP
jgi:1-acyl-sn-glycerol-3-phosphate acyltransferase